MPNSPTEHAPYVPPSTRSVTEATSALADRWGGSFRDDSEGETEERAPSPMRRQRELEEIPAEAVDDSADNAEALDSGEREEVKSSGEAEQFSTLHELLAAGAVDPSALQVAIKVNGTEENITLAEALEGYSREADYRHKTTELAEQRRALDAERQTATQAVAQIGQQAQALRGVLDAAFQKQLDDVTAYYGGVDWNALARQDRTEFMFQQNQYQQSLAAVQARKEEALSTLDAKVNEALGPAGQITQETVQRQTQRLVELVPEWTDLTVREKEGGDVAKYFSDSYGLSEQEIGSLVDARYWALGRKGHRHDAWEAKAKVIGRSVDEILEAATNAPKLAEEARRGTLRPGSSSGSPRGSGRVRAESDAMAQLKKSHKQQDAVEAMKARLAARGVE